MEYAVTAVGLRLYQYAIGMSALEKCATVPYGKCPRRASDGHGTVARIGVCGSNTRNACIYIATRWREECVPSAPVSMSGAIAATRGVPRPGGRYLAAAASRCASAPGR